MRQFQLIGWEETGHVLPPVLLAVWDIEVIAEAQAAILAPGAHEDGEATRMEESLSLMIAEPLA